MLSLWENNVNTGGKGLFRYTELMLVTKDGDDAPAHQEAQQ